VNDPETNVSTSPEVLVAANDVELASLAAELIARGVDEAARERGIARVALSGGSTPAPAYRALAAYDLPWSQTELYLVDERAVPPDSDRSNHRMIAAAFEPATARGAKLFRMEAEQPDRRVAALTYDRALRRSFGVTRSVDLDVVVLGIGDDGHTASLFPGRGSTAIDDRLVAAVDAADGLEPRLTLTVPTLVSARLVVVLARGSSKRGPITAALTPGDLEAVPARVIAACRGRVVWVVDRDAAP